MKKILLAVFVLAATTCSAFAQTPANANNTQRTPTATCERKGPMPECCNPFEGLNITADQQAKLDALKAECKARFEKSKADRQKEKANKKADKMKAKAEARAKMKAEREQMLAKIKGILTPEQYVQFLENNFVNGASKGPRMDKDFKGPRGDRKGDAKAPKRDGNKMKRDNK